MCGITGYLCDDPGARAALPAMTSALAHRGPDADGFHVDGPVGLRPPPIVRDRSRRQPAAARLGRRRHCRRVQRRNLQLPRVAARTPVQGTRLRHQRRRRGAHSRLEGLGPADAGPALRHVRLRALGPRAARALPRARPSRRQAALLRVAPRRLRLRLGVEGTAPVPRPAACARSRCPRALSRVPVHPGADERLPRHPQAAGRPLAVGEGRRARFGRILAPDLRAQARPCAGGGDRTARNGTVALGRVDAGRRRSARRVRERRSGFRA